MARNATDLAQLLIGMAGKLSSDQILDPSRIIVSLAPDEDWEKSPIDDQFLIIGLGRFALDNALFDGAGRLAPTFDGAVRVTLWSRLATDVTDQDADGLTNPSLGLLELFRRVHKSLVEYDIVDTATTPNQITQEPMRCLGFSVPPRKDVLKWEKLVSFWETKWTQSVA